MGWRAQRAARSGGTKRVEGGTTRTMRVDGSADPVSPEAEAMLAEALDRRAEPAFPSVPLDVVRPVLEKRGLSLQPAPAEGRDFGDDAKRLQASELVLRARHASLRGEADAAKRDLEAALALDADNPGVRLDLAQVLSGADPRRSRELLSRAITRYPTHPELLHWYAHAVWADSWREAESLLELIEPYKSAEADVLYDLACTRSLGDDLEASESYLRRAIAAGYLNFTHMETDPDLRNLRESGRFATVVREHR